jgi:hypothetical protein
MWPLRAFKRGQRRVEPGLGVVRHHDSSQTHKQPQIPTAGRSSIEGDALFREVSRTRTAMTTVTMRTPHDARARKLRRLLRWKPKRTGLVLGLCASTCVSCGAATALDFDPPTKDSASKAAPGTPKPGNMSHPDGRPGSPSGGGTGAGKGDDIELPTFDLPDCERGAAPNTVPDCPYLAEGLCYDDVKSACACACSRSEDTFCFEGLFLNVWNGVDVWCSER